MSIQVAGEKGATEGSCCTPDSLLSRCRQLNVSAIFRHCPGFFPGSPPAISQSLLEVHLLSQPWELTPQNGNGVGENRSGEDCGQRRELPAHLNVGHIRRGQQAGQFRMAAVTAGGPWRSTHGILARQLSCTQLCTLRVARLLAVAPPPPGDLMYQVQPFDFFMLG